MRLRRASPFLLRQKVAKDHCAWHDGFGNIVLHQLPCASRAKQAGANSHIHFRKQQLERQSANDLMKQFAAAENPETGGAPGAGAKLLAQVAPPPELTREQFDQYLSTPRGNAWQSMLNQEIQVGAKNAMSVIPFVDHFDQRNIPVNVRWDNMDLSPTGRFQGFFNRGGAKGSNDQYPRTEFGHGNNYNESLINSVSPSYWKYLKQ